MHWLVTRAFIGVSLAVQLVGLPEMRNAADNE
jgi:hypothetical protein